MSATLAELKDLSAIIQNITAATVMAAFLYLFVRGEIVSKKTVDQIIAGLVSQIKNDMETKFDEMGKKIDRIGSRVW